MLPTSFLIAKQRPLVGVSDKGLIFSTRSRDDLERTARPGENPSPRDLPLACSSRETRAKTPAPIGTTKVSTSGKLSSYLWRLQMPTLWEIGC